MWLRSPTRRVKYIEKIKYDVYGRLTALWVLGVGDVTPSGGFISAQTYYANSITKNPYLFQGRRLDEESGLYYFRNRYYDPEHGRFISRDPEGFVDGPNLYSFVNNNPINYVDPLGTSIYFKDRDEAILFRDWLVQLRTEQGKTLRVMLEIDITDGPNENAKHRVTVTYREDIYDLISDLVEDCDKRALWAAAGDWQDVIISNVKKGKAVYSYKIGRHGPYHTGRYKHDKVDFDIDYNLDTSLITYGKTIFFYESGNDIAKVIAELNKTVSPDAQLVALDGPETFINTLRSAWDPTGFGIKKLAYLGHGSAGTLSGGDAAVTSGDIAGAHLSRLMGTDATFNVIACQFAPGERSMDAWGASLFGYRGGRIAGFSGSVEMTSRAFPFLPTVHEVKLLDENSYVRYLAIRGGYNKGAMVLATKSWKAKKFFPGNSWERIGLGEGKWSVGGTINPEVLKEIKEWHP